MRSLIASLLLLTAGLSAQAQPCSSIPGMTPQTAIAVCGTTTFTQNSVSTCTGPAISGFGACGSTNQSDNAFWYKFHCYQAGTLGFLITPMNLNDDYDWEVFDVTGLINLNQIYTDERLMVSLNLCGNPNGITGCSPLGTDSINCGGNTFLYNRLATLTAGHDYMLMVNRFSSSPFGYTLDFVGGNAVITDPNVPAVTNVSTDGCHNSLLDITFSKDILCSSVTLNGSEFSITPGNPVVNNVIVQCPTPTSTVAGLTIKLQNPLPAGNYNLVVNPGGDGNTFRDVCGTDMATGFTIPFTIVQATTPPVIQSVVVDPCHRDKVVVNFDKPVNCATFSGAGSEMYISPGVWPVNTITMSCTNNQYTTQVTMNMASPLPGGNYNVAIRDGSDNNTLSDTCSAFMPVGYTYPFVAVPPLPPVITTFDYDNCKRDKLVVHFSNPILCSTIAADGSDFILFPPTGTAVTSISTNCAGNAYVSEVTLNLSAPMPPLQSLNVMIMQGTDNTTIADTCYSFIPQYYTNNYTAPPTPPRPVVDSMQYDRCSASFFKVYYSKPILCNSISPDGSQFVFVPQPGQVAIVSATPDPATCAQGYTNWVLVQFATPFNVPNTRILWHTTGSDGRNLRDTCNLTPPLALPFLNILGKPSAVFNAQVNWGCVNDDIVLTHPGGNGINSWTWNFSDGRTATGQNVTMSFPIATPTVTVQLIVSNGFCSDTTSQIITLGNVINAAFTASTGDTICINTPINFTEASTGNIVNYLWDFGDFTQFNGQAPPTHSYPVTNTYNVQLIITDNNGCRDTASKLIRVDPSARIDFSGLKPQYCTGNTVSLQRVISRNITSYVWDNGDGKTFTNEVDVTFSYPNQGVYTITLSGIDRYCGPATISKTVPVYAVPKVSLGPDTVICQADRLLLGVAPDPAYTYVWNTGATSSQIYADPFTRDYTLTADNHGCRGYDAVKVKVLAVCMIKVPNAFTPNGDGLNDELKALNADLATNFSFKVYNRVGQLVFTGTNPLQGWDGKFKGNPADGGTYVWTLTYIDPWTGKAVKEKGTSILLR